MWFESALSATPKTSQPLNVDARTPCIGHQLMSSARLATELLDPESRNEIAAFIRNRQHADGGYCGRTNDADLYYTLFALQCLDALDEPLPESSRGFVADINPDDLDLVHLSCLARAQALLGSLNPPRREAILAALHRHRSTDGAFRLTRRGTPHSLYAGFLALLAYEACESPPPEIAPLMKFFGRCRNGDGGHVDLPGAGDGATTVTAAAVVCRWALREGADAASMQWLLDRWQSTGGFEPSPGNGLADLLSTATALFALKLAGVSVPHLAASCFSYVSGLWQQSGGFASHQLDPVPDCEYSFYALVTLGVLAEAL